MGVEGLRCVVTGGSGLCGRRLVEMLVERGAQSVVSFDVRRPELEGDMNFLTPEQEARVEYVIGDITKPESIIEACKGADCVWHVAAVVGPFHPKELYYKVNYEGTLNVIQACKENGVPKLIMSTSPSTRFSGEDVDGLTEDEMPIRKPGEFLEAYAETKAMGELAVREACSPSLMTVAIAPHQVYGPRDSLFLPNLMLAMKKGVLRVLGNGMNNVSLTHVDNYCHALVIAYDRLFEGSPILGKYYVVTDGGKRNLWRTLDDAGTRLGYESLFSKTKVPYWFIMGVAVILQMITQMTGYRFRLTPFTVKMLTIHRWFRIENAERDLEYKPIIEFEDGWNETIDWFRDHTEWWEAKAAATGKS